MYKLHNSKQQQGAALIVALVFLIVITLLGVSSLDDTVLETKLAKNTREQHYALQAAEMGLMGSAPLLLEKSPYLVVLMQNGQLTSAESTTDDLGEIAVQRDDISTTDYIINASSQGTEIHFKGRFKPGKGYGKKFFQSAFFETITQGESAPGQRQIKLRNGIIVQVPSQ